MKKLLVSCFFIIGILMGNETFLLTAIYGQKLGSVPQSSGNQKPGGFSQRLAPPGIPRTPIPIAPKAPTRAPQAPVVSIPQPPARVPQAPVTRIPQPPARVPQAPVARVPRAPVRVPQTKTHTLQTPSRVPQIPQRKNTKTLPYDQVPQNDKTSTKPSTSDSNKTSPLKSSAKIDASTGSTIKKGATVLDHKDNLIGNRRVELDAATIQDLRTQAGKISYGEISSVISQKKSSNRAIMSQLEAIEENGNESSWADKREDRKTLRRNLAKNKLQIQLLLARLSWQRTHATLHPGDAEGIGIPKPESLMPQNKKQKK